MIIDHMFLEAQKLELANMSGTWDCMQTGPKTRVVMQEKYHVLVTMAFPWPQVL